MDAETWKTFLSRRDEPSFTRIYEATKARVYTICRRLNAGEDDALEAFQSTWTRLLVEARDGRVPRGAEPLAHISRLAVREADALRQRRRRRATREVLMEELPEQPDAALSAREEIANTQQRELLLGLIEKLPEQQRLPVLMHYFDGLTHQEISAILDVPLGTISYRIAEALKRLQPMCRRAGIESAAGALATIAAGAALMMPPASATAASAFATANISAAAASSAAGGFVITKGAVAMVVGAVIGLFLVLKGVDFFYLKHQPRVAGISASIPGPTSVRSDSGDMGIKPSDAVSLPRERDEQIQTRVAANSSPAPAAPSVEITVHWADTNEAVAGAVITHLDAEGKPAKKTAASFIDVAHDEAEGGKQRFALPKEGRLNAKLKRGTIAFGTVLNDDDDSPAFGANVTLALWDDRITTTTLADGTFVMRVKAPNGGIIFATTDTRNSLAGNDPNVVNLKANVRNGPYTLRLREGRLLSVLVLDATTKSPIPGAEVLADYGELHITDDTGVARFPALSQREWQFRVTANAYAAKRITANLQTMPDAVLEAQLEPDGLLFGRVVNEEGQPLENVRVRYLFSGPSLFGRRTFTDADGRYEMGHWPLGENSPGLLRDLDVAFEKEGFVDVIKHDLKIPTDTRSLETNVTMPRGVGLSGTVVDSRNAPIPGASVEFGGQSSNGFRETRTDTLGRFQLSGISKENSDTLMVSSIGFAPYSREVNPSLESDLRVVLDPGNAIRARVLDSNGKPIAGVTVVPLLSAQTYHYLDGTKTDQEGMFEFKSLGKDSIFDIYTTGYTQLRSHPLPLNQPNVIDVILPGEGIVFGRVTQGEEGTPVTRFNIRIKPLNPENPSERFSYIEVSRMERGAELDSPDGSFRLGELNANSPVQVTVTSEGFAPHQEKFYAQPDGTARQITIKLSR